MLELYFPGSELFDEDSETFLYTNPANLQFEHSLISLSKWESIHKKPFLVRKDKTLQELVSYAECMCLNKNLDKNIFLTITQEQLKIISDYIGTDQTATTFSNIEKTHRSEVITSELIYYWMFSYQISKECERWHLSRLLTLINIFSVKNQPAKKMSQKDIAKRNRAINAARRAKHRSKG